VICSWCYIGKRGMERALELLATEMKGEVKRELRWLPFERNPHMPAGGVPRAE
jgi:predicted DsbA family dithiol-disulfide isomerase